MMLRAVIVALCAGTALGMTDCNKYNDCTSCLNPDLAVLCAWCSPDPVTFQNGSTGYQCMDRTEQDFQCTHLYQYDGCVAGYICDESSGQCVITEPGEGDTQENCEKSCNVPPSPTPMYECNVQTFTCEESDDGDAAQSTCDAACADETPAQLVGLWRGLSVNEGFATGEWVMNFSASSVTYGTAEKPDTVTADVATVGPQLIRLTVTAPSDQAGNVKYASWANYPYGPETNSVTVALQTDLGKQTPPQDVTQAMGDSNFYVFVMSACNSYDQVTCDFSSAFSAAATKTKAKLLASKKAKAAVAARKLSDDDGPSCQGFSDCDSCVGGNAVCGWCDGVAYDGNGNALCGMDGNGCCAGNGDFSYCEGDASVGLRKYCPVMCDYTEDAANPTCRAATTPEYLTQQTYASCDDMTWCTTTYNYCDTTAEQCAQAHSKEECDANPDCDSDNVNGCDSKCQQKSYIYCDTVLGCQSTTSQDECDANPECDSNSDDQTCDPSKCSAQMYYTCDPSSLTCKAITGPFPTDNSTYFNTTDECDTACVSVDLSGVWRGIQISDGFEKGEWDFKFTATDGTFKSPSGETGTATYQIGEAISPTQGYDAAEIELTLDDGTKLVGVVNNDRAENSAKGPVTKFLYLALPTDAAASVTSFDAGMSAMEFVMFACLDTVTGCDFTSASP